jgi:hypothetical protein
MSKAEATSNLRIRVCDPFLAPFIEMPDKGDFIFSELILNLIFHFKSPCFV